MHTFYSVQQTADHLAHGALAIGNFDGVHLGHQALIKKILELKGAYKSGVLTFSPHPAAILTANPHTRLTTDTDKIHLFRLLGVDVTVIEKVDAAFLATTPEQFVQETLVEKLKVKHVVVGHDFSFGKKKAGNVALLQSLGQKLGFQVHAIQPVMIEGQRCSSTTIRQFLRAGKLPQAQAMLGRPYSLRGTVIRGNQLGGSLGFRTANIMPFAGFCLSNGVYASITRVYEETGYKDLVSATNVGTRPTITDDQAVVVETHCLDENPYLYDQEIEVFFVQLLRDEEKFASTTALQEQVQKDCLKVRQMAHDHPQLFQVAS